MAFSPGLKTTSLDVSPDYAFLASEHMMMIRSGITLDNTQVVADGNGDKLLAAGTVLGKVTASGKYGPYDDGAADGTETAVGFLTEDVNMKDGDVVVGMLTHGSVIVARTTGLDANGRTDLAGRFFWFE